MKRSPKPGDMNQRMYAVVQEAAGLTQAPTKDPKAVERGRAGGLARAAALTPEQRQETAKRAREARKVREAAAEAAEMRKRA
jgi:hypothetical protein